MAAALKKVGVTRPAGDWWRIRFALEKLTGELGCHDPELATMVVERGVGSRAEMDILERCGHKDIAGWTAAKLTAMRAERPSSQAATTFSDPAELRGEDAADLLNALADADKAATREHAKALYDTGEPAWMLGAMSVWAAPDMEKSNATMRSLTQPLLHSLLSVFPTRIPSRGNGAG
jgi:hypothetical protein